MDTRSGDVGPLDRFLGYMSQDEQKKYLRPVDPANLSIQHRHELITTGRTVVGPRSRCPCGSGHRFKRCCMAGAAR
jgi:uncharacterized protein YchJ